MTDYLTDPNALNDGVASDFRAWVAAETMQPKNRYSMLPTETLHQLYPSISDNGPFSKDLQEYCSFRKVMGLIHAQRHRMKSDALFAKAVKEYLRAARGITPEQTAGDVTAYTRLMQDTTRFILVRQQLRRAYTHDYSQNYAENYEYHRQESICLTAPDLYDDTEGWEKRWRFLADLRNLNESSAPF